MEPPPPDAGGGFDVTPAHLHYVSYRLRNSQITFSEKAGSVLSQLEGDEHAGGCGTGPEAFAASYAKVAKRFFEVWDRAVGGVGGASVGLTMTANFYVGAEYRAHPTPGPPPTKPLPDVLPGKGYRPVPELGWGNPPEESGFGHTIINNVVGALGAIGGAVLRPVLKYALRHGKIADITPGGDDIALPRIAAAWRQAKGDAKTAADDFDGAVSYITPKSGNSEWQDAMKSFCSSIWGTTAWGQERNGYKWGRGDLKKPAIEVLMDTAEELAVACTAFGKEVEKVRGVIEDVYIDAAKKVFEVNNVLDALTLFGGPPEYALEFILNLDTARLNAGVDSYNTAVNALAVGLDKLPPALDEAYRSIPTYEAEEGRAEAFATRAVNEFKNQHTYLQPDGPDNHFYPLDLAGQEDMRGSHGVDRHVGLSDEQLAQRLRDQSGAPSASAYPDLATAQRFTTAALDNEDNAVRIDEWLKRVEQKIANNPNWNPENSGIQPAITLTFSEVTGKTVDQTAYAADGLKAKPTDVHSVQIALKYKKDTDPPFVVLTTYPVGP